MADPNASVWKQILDRLDSINAGILAQLPETDLAARLGAKRFDVRSIEQQLAFRAETFGARLQRFKEGQGFSVSEISSITGASGTPAATQYKKLRVDNPSDSPVVIVVTEAHLAISALNFWVIENPVKTSAVSSGTKIGATNKRAGSSNSSAVVDYITSATAPSRPFHLSGRVGADTFLRVPVGGVLPPGSSQLIDLNFAAGTEAWALGAEWFEVPLL